MPIRILTIQNKKEEEFLRKPTKLVENISDPKIVELIKKMKGVLIAEKGAGLAANQIGEDLRIFIAQFEGKSFVFINPEITKTSKKTNLMEEGCLSVPGIIGLVPRPKKITIRGFDEKSQKVKIKISEMLARIFQHEVDHLNGVLFIDKAEKIHPVK